MQLIDQVREFRRVRPGGPWLDGTPANDHFDPHDATLPIDPELRLLHRACYGYSQQMEAEIRTRGFDAWLDWQLNPDTIVESAELTALLANYTDQLTMTPAQINAAYPPSGTGAASFNAFRTKFIELWAVRAVFSQKQLFERVVEMWTDHFSIDLLKGSAGGLVAPHDREVIRRYALTSFPQLLRAVTESAAMLYYLDNYLNIVGVAQENFARELMELHTMGVDGGYTQNDVMEVARCLTGWTINTQRTSPDYGKFLYSDFLHDKNAKIVLGQTIPARGGKNDGDQVLDILLAHPATPKFIARKICEFFVGHHPAQEVVDYVASVYRATNGDIKSMIRAVLGREILMNWAKPKFKRPMHLVASTLRPLSVSVTTPGSIRQQLTTLGQIPYTWPTPDGFSDEMPAWAGNMLTRWSFVSNLALGYIPGVTFDTDQLNWIVGAEASNINAVLTGGMLSDHEVFMLQDYFNRALAAHRGDRVRALTDMLSAAASCPTFQYY